MSTYIEFNVLKQLNDDFLKNIKIIYVFGHKVSEVLIVTKNDTVFGFGQNDWGVLGLGHNRQVFEPKIVKELSGKGIIKLVNGVGYVFGLTNNGNIYSWGRNDLSQLGNGMRNNSCNKPEINEFLINEVIIDISCGEYHSLVLTEKFELFVWGYNDYGQIGNESEDLCQLTPLKLKAFRGENIVAISSGFHHSLALTDKGNVFSWGRNDRGQLGIEENERTYNMFTKKVLKENKPILVKIKNAKKTHVFIVKICCGCNHSMLLSSDEKIYTFGDNVWGQIGNNGTVYQRTPQKINSSIKYKDIASHFRYNISIAVSVNNIFYIWGKLGKNHSNVPKESQFKSVNDILLTYNQITHKSNPILYNFETIINSSFDNKEIECKTEENSDNGIIQNDNHLNLFSLLLSPEIIAKYRKETRIKANFNQNMKIAFHFLDRDSEWPNGKIGRNTLFVAEDSKVFSSGSNGNGLIDFDRKNEINESIIVNELCYKGIIDFANGVKHVIARTDKNQLFIWGYNSEGQLGNETYDDCFVPQLVEKLSDKCIVDVCCGDFHSLALTKNGELYSWGDNKYGQIGNESDNSCVLTPLKIQKLDEQKIIAISCGAYHSLALTESGRVYSWGHNNCGQLSFTKIIGSNKPKRIKVKNTNKIELKFKKISCGFEYSLLLSSDGDIYGFGSNSFGQLANDNFVNHFIPTKIMNKNKFIEIASHKDFDLSAALSIDEFYYIWGNCNEIITEPKATQFNSFNNIFFNYCEISYNRCQIDIKQSKDFLRLKEQNINYLTHFQEYGLIAFGSFGIVSKVRDNNENEICAIKRIAFKDKQKDSVLKEFQIMSQLNCDFVVKVKNYWIENNYLLKDGFEQFKDSEIESISSDHRSFDPKNDLLLHIQMELCFKSLKEIIKVMNKELNSNFVQIMSQIYYYITSELLIEILESVDYLHKRDPPIIHRDLKPVNILITYGINGRFVKLCGFGFVESHEFDGQSHSLKGTFKYMAPEVLRAQKYNTKADVYSLAVVIQELIKDFKEQIKTKPEMICFGKYEKLSVLPDIMMKEQEFRPNCESILNQKNSWAMSISDIENDNLLKEISNKSFSIEDNFHYFFIKKKLEISKQFQSDTSARDYKISYNRSQIDIKQSTDFLRLKEQNINYLTHFQEYGIIALGSFGIVSKVRDNNENEICAIKRIAFKDKQKDSVLKEFQIMSQLNCDFVVKVKNYWIENNYLLKDGFEQFKDSEIESISSDHRLFDPKNDLLLHIQMELCFKSLKEIIKVIYDELNSNFEEIITQIYYYITSELLIEILESVDYIHKSNPPIIHRNLKPVNILITHGINGRFVKLCGFGFAESHEFEGQSHSLKGTFKYMAPEVLRAQKYNTKADVYSLAVVIQELIKDFKERIEAKSEMICFGKYEKLSALVVLMMKEQELRPNCESILYQKNSWALSISDIGNDTFLKEISNKSSSIEENFHSFFIKKKLEISKHSNT